MVEIPLTKNYVAWVDDCDAYLAKLRWYALVIRRRDGTVLTVYACRNGAMTNGKRNGILLLHRVILNVTDPLIEVDHKNGNGLDCQRENLRRTNGQNQHNQRARRAGTCTSDFKGVSWHRRDKRWRATILAKHIGNFSDEVKAAEAYDAEAKRLFGEYACINFPLKEVA